MAEITSVVISYVVGCCALATENGFPRLTSCQPLVSGNVLGSSGCTLAAGEHKIASVWLLGKD